MNSDFQKREFVVIYERSSLLIKVSIHELSFNSWMINIHESLATNTVSHLILYNLTRTMTFIDFNFDAEFN